MSRFFKIVLVNACVCLAATEGIHPLPAQELTAKKPILVVLIGGMDSDPTPAQIQGKAARHQGNSGMYQLRGDLEKKGLRTEYFNWNGTRAGKLKDPAPPHAEGIAEYLREDQKANPQTRLMLVGNSWGGHTAWQVCQLCSEKPSPLVVEYLVFLDPSSFGRKTKVPQPKLLPENVHKGAHFFTRNAFVWKHWPNEPRLDNIDLGDPQAGFLRNMGPAYHSRLDFSAHVAAEWDERIHAEIVRRLMEHVEAK